MTSIESRVGARRLPVGAEVLGPEIVHSRVWAPRCRTVHVVVENESGNELRSLALDREAGGYFGGLVEDAHEGMLYRYRLDQGDRFPDPASRFQPHGPHGPSMVVDPGKFRWTDEEWRGPALTGAINFDGPGCEPVREFAIANACYWVDEFHLDGLRLDATQSIFDDSDTHIITDIAAGAREATRARRTLIIGENEPRHVRRFLDGLLDHLDEYGVGSLAEIFDAEEPYTPRGCIAQAWSVAEVLRCFVRVGGEGGHRTGLQGGR